MIERIRWLVPAVLALVTVGVSRGFAQDTVTDYDRRAARALFNTVRANSAPTARNADPNRLDQFARRDRRVIYTINIPGKDNGSMLSGYYRISVNTEWQDVTQLGWTVGRKDAHSGVEIIYKNVEMTTGEKYSNFAVRRRFGNVQLIVAQRRPFGETVDGAAPEMLPMYEKLLANAKANKLFARVELTLQAGEAGEEQEATGEPMFFTLPSGDIATRLDYIVRVVDSDGQSLTNVKRLRLSVGGFASPHVKIESPRAVYDRATKTYTIEDPREAEQFTLVVGGAGSALAAALYKELERDGAGEEPPFRIRVGAQFK